MERISTVCSTKNQLLFYAEVVDLSGRNTNQIKTQVLFVTNTEIGQEINRQNQAYGHVFSRENRAQSHGIKSS